MLRCGPFLRRHLDPFCSAVDTDGRSATLILAGPGPNNNTDNRPSRLIVAAGGKIVVIFRPSYGVVISSPGGAPSTPKYFTPAQIAALVGKLNARPLRQQGGSGGSDPLQGIALGGVAPQALNSQGLLGFTNQNLFSEPTLFQQFIAQSPNPSDNGFGSGGSGAGGGGSGSRSKVACVAGPASAKGKGFAFGRCK